ncbi:MAG: D-alanine--D-alanine ligase [Chitinophagaceae bacterium]|nr:D-alanine--D-alanine ligase [Chitinophagaceae bacterium]
MFKKLQQQSWFIKLTNWEYWPFNLVYVPIYLYWIWLFIRVRSVFFFNTSNPLIKNGGFLLESKKEIYDLIPEEYYPATLFFKTGTAYKNVCIEVTRAGLEFPLIAKPDIGMRGLMVQKINTPEELMAYTQHANVNFLVQDFIEYENEVGLFYYRYPNERKGHISGIVGKEFLSVTGDGVSTIETLLMKDQRFILQLPVLKETHAETLNIVLQQGEHHLLVPYGNHSRGSKFIDISNLIDDELETAIDKVCIQIPEFYFGRMDIRYNTWEELKQGKNFSIIELNGAGSEPTHIYDPIHSIFFAWKEIIRHLNILQKISRINHQRTRIPYMDFTSGIRMLKENTDYVKLISVNLKQSV